MAKAISKSYTQDCSCKYCCTSSHSLHSNSASFSINLNGRLSNIFKTRNTTKLTKAILESSYSVLLVTSKWKTLKQPVCFLKTFKFRATFNIQIDKCFCKSCDATLFRKPMEVSQNSPTFISIGPPITI